MSLQELKALTDAVQKSFQKIAPSWPIQHFVAVNPLKGLESLPIEQALQQAAVYFQEKIPEAMTAVNREHIKWLQAYFDEGQATIAMPCREEGLYKAWKQHALYDVKLHGNDPHKQQWIQALPDQAQEALIKVLSKLDIHQQAYELFLTLALTTLPGWASYIVYRTQWARTAYKYPVTQTEYLAVRLIIMYLIWPQAQQLLDWYEHTQKKVALNTHSLNSVMQLEQQYRIPLLQQLAQQSIQKMHIPQAQWIFCIDVRSEPFRKALESTGDYQTFGYAGFFGLPIEIQDAITQEVQASCPVAIAPVHRVQETPSTQQCELSSRGYRRWKELKKLYQSLKYTFTTPFALAEGLGIFSGIWMAIRSSAPQAAFYIKSLFKKMIYPQATSYPCIDSIPYTDQCSYAEKALRMIGLTTHFAPIVVLCGHGSTTHNNAYGTALDCGACGGRHGGTNAKVLAAILNHCKVRQYLEQQGICIPQTTCFIGAEHDTTTDHVTLYTHDTTPLLQQLKANLSKAQALNSQKRLATMGCYVATSQAAYYTKLRSQDWAQVRAEWGLAGNHALIVAPRDISKNIDLQGRCFLHSYDYAQDHDGKVLKAILTAPMIVAQWINAQYLFSTLDHTAYGGGSKVTKNITGKMGVMQGTASDLMTGLSLQSVSINDTTMYHKPQRLMTVIYALRITIDQVIASEISVRQLCVNGWVQLACIEPEQQMVYMLQRDLTWSMVDLESKLS